MTFLIPIFAFWPFASIAMLLWGLAAAIPVIIHLWNRRRYQEMPWAAMEYLLAAIRRRSRRITIEQLILLALRVVILLVLALAVADPFWPASAPLAGGLGASGSTHWVLVLDGSYSMDYRQAGTSRFDVAKELAAQLVDESTQGDGFTLVVLGEPPRVVVREPAFDRDDIIEEIRNLSMHHAGANLPPTLAEVEKILQTSRKRHSRLSRNKVCFFTDLGRTTWEEVSAADCRRRVGRIGELASLILFDLGEPGRQNLAVTRLEIEESLVTAGRDVSFRAGIQNFGSQPQLARKVEFRVDGRPVHEQPVNVPPLGQTTAEMTHRFSVPGEHFVEVRVADDLLPVDNYRWMSVPVRESIRVLCVEGKTGAARHVALALEPVKSLRPRVRVDRLPENAIVESSLHPYDCVFLANVGRFGNDEARVLFDYLQDGGGVVFLLGDQVQPDNYNRLLGGRTSKRRVLPAQLGTASASEPQYAFDPGDYRHPIVAPFRGHEGAGLLTTPVWKYFKLTPYDQTTAKIALAFEGGDPAIVEELIGRGRSIMYASAVSGASVDRSKDPPMQWTAIHTWPSFLPLMQEILRLAVSGRTAERNLLVGDPLQGVIYGSVAEVPLKVVGPDEQSERVKTRVDGGDSRWDYGGTQRSGIYEAQLGPPVSSSQLYAVNVNTRESDLERLDPELLPSQFNQEFKVEDSAPAQLPTSRGANVFQFVLLFLLVLLFVEMGFAWLFGRDILAKLFASLR